MANIVNFIDGATASSNPIYDSKETFWSQNKRLATVGIEPAYTELQSAA